MNFMMRLIQCLENNIAKAYIKLHGKVYGKRIGMDGPYQYPNDRVLYYDLKEKLFYDPTSDYFLADEDIAELKQSVFNLIKG